MPKVVYTAKKGLIQQAGSGVDLSGNTLRGGLRKVRTVESADSASGITLGAADSGIIVSIKTSVGGVAITLPTATSAGAGWYCDVCYQAATPGGNVTFTGGTFKVVQARGGAVTDAATSGTTLTCLTAGSTAGDRARIWCDGVLYYVQAGASGTGIFAAA